MAQGSSENDGHKGDELPADRARAVREGASRYRALLQSFLPQSRELSLAITKVDEAELWGLKAVERG